MAGGDPLHVVFLPYLSAGHFIPLVNVARLFASRGVKSTILSTPHNSSFFRSTVEDDFNILGNPIFIEALKFPSAEVGLPEGIESFSTAISPEMTYKVLQALLLLQKPMEDKIRELQPDCIFSDTYYPWTVDLAKELNIPRILYNLSTYMCYSIMYNLRVFKPHKEISDESESFLVPGLPDKIHFKLSQITYDLRKPENAERTLFDGIVEQVLDKEDRSYGIVQDTFYELEPAYADYYQSVRKPKCWHIGPITYFASTIRNTRESTAQDSSKLSGSNAVVEWLNDHKPKSVLFVSFGSMARFPNKQLTEIAQSLEASGVPFIWVLRKHQETTWFPDGFEERAAKSKTGLLIRGWAPQITILEHSSIGGFLTHCGTNSVLEAIVAGVPFVTWPLYADQFWNEKQIEVLGLGIGVGIDKWNFGIEITGPVIRSETIKEAIARLMNDTEESRNIRERAMAMSNKAKAAVIEGGSSWNSLTGLIDSIRNFHSSSTTA